MSIGSTGEMMEMEPVNWYEASLPVRERKRRGHFSTPPLLVERMLDACGYCPENDLSRLRVLDPACGSGNFLVGAARRLAAFAARAGLCESEATALVARNLWGFDPDPVSCLLAEMNVRALCQPCEGGRLDGEREADKSAVGALNRPLRNGPESLLNTRDGDAIEVKQDIPARLHIHQADGLALAWDGYEGVDVFLANPPYLAAKNTDLSGYRSTYRGGQMDSYLLFLDLALDVVRPGGWLGLVLPDPVLARANASRQRARLLETCTITHLWHLSGVFAAHVGAVVLIARKSPAPATHLISWQRAGWSHDLGKRAALDAKDAQGRQTERQEQHAKALNTVSQSLFRRQPGSELRYLLSSERGAIVERLRVHLDHASGPARRLAQLSDFLTIKRGEELGRKSARLVREQRQAEPAGHPSAAPGHPSAAPGHPQTAPGHPSAAPGHPSAAPGHPQTAPGHPSAPGHPQTAPGHPSAPGHPQGVALLYTSHPPDRQSFVQRTSGGVYSRATPCGWPGAVCGWSGGDGWPGAADGWPGAAGGWPVGDGWSGTACGWPEAAGVGTYFPVLLGGVDVKPYGRPAGKCWLASEAIEKPLARYLAPKLLVVKSTGQLQAALDMEGHVALQTLYLLHARAGVDGDDLYFFLALLNSRVLREYVYVLHTAYKWVQPQIEQQVLARLPVPLAEVAEKRAVIERAKRLMELLEVIERVKICREAGAVVELKQQWQGLYEEQERAIEALYAAALEGNHG